MTASTRRKKKPKARAKRRKAASGIAKRVANLEEVAKIRGETIDIISQSVAMHSDSIRTLNGSLKASLAGSTAIAAVLTRYLVVLRDILIEKGVISAEEAVAFFQIAELKSMLGDQPSAPPNDSDRREEADE